MHIHKSILPGLEDTTDHGVVLMKFVLSQSTLQAMFMSPAQLPVGFTTTMQRLNIMLTEFNSGFR